MDKFEKFITDHRGEFDIYEPSSDIWNKIDPSGKKASRKMTWIWKAAIVLLALGASYWADKHIRTDENSMAKKIDRAIPELAEAEKYYTGLIRTKMNEMQPYLASFPEIKKDLREELAELDSTYKSLRNDLKDNVSNEDVIEAMIQNYRLKLQLLEEIQMELQSQKNKQPRYDL